MKPEALLSAEIAGWCHAWLPDDVYATVIPGGGWRFRMGQLWRRMGYRAGTPDWIITYQRCAYWIELKAGRGTTSEVQDKTHQLISRTGCPLAVVRSLDAWIGTLRAWHIPQRVTPRGDSELPDDPLPF